MSAPILSSPCQGRYVGRFSPIENEFEHQNGRKISRIILSLAEEHASSQIEPSLEYILNEGVVRFFPQLEDANFHDLRKSIFLNILCLIKGRQRKAASESQMKV